MSPDKPQLRSILDVPARCPECGWVGITAECEFDIDGDGGMGCPNSTHYGKPVKVIFDYLPHERNP